MEVRPVAICVPQEIQEYCMELFVEDVQIAAASHDLFAKRANELLFGSLVDGGQVTVALDKEKNELTYGFQSAQKHKAEAAH